MSFEYQNILLIISTIIFLIIVITCYESIPLFLLHFLIVGIIVSLLLLVYIYKIIRKCIAWFRIPPGPYCYFGSRAPGDKKYRPCPYWSIKEDLPPQENGYCKYLKVSDHDMDWIGLLWDQCKECGIKDNEYYDDYYDGIKISDYERDEDGNLKKDKNGNLVRRERKNGNF